MTLKSGGGLSSHRTVYNNLVTIYSILSTRTLLPHVQLATRSCTTRSWFLGVCVKQPNATQLVLWVYKGNVAVTRPFGSRVYEYVHAVSKHI